MCVCERERERERESRREKKMSCERGIIRTRELEKRRFAIRR